MRTIKYLIVAMLLFVATAMSAANWKGLHFATGSLTVDTVAKVWTGTLYPCKFDLADTDSLTFYVEASDSAAVVVKLLTYTITGILADTITVGTKTAGTKYKVVKVPYKTIPSHVFTFKALLSITNSYAVKTTPLLFRSVLIYKED